jgi:hypothetical protein
MPYSSELRVIGLKKESVRGTPETDVSRFIAVGKSSEMDYKPALLEDESIRGMFDKLAPVQGIKEGTGKISDLDVESDNCGELLLSLLGAVTSAAQQTLVVVAGTNDKIDFNIGADALAATVAAGSYAPGATQADAGTLCKAIHDAIVAAEAAGTYTVSYSATTRLFTITRSAGTLNILWNSGANKAKTIATLIGFSTAGDDTGGLTYSSDTAIKVGYKHTFKRAASSITLQSYTLFIDQVISKKSYSMACVKSVKIAGAMDGKAKLDADIIFKAEASASAVTMTPTWEEPDPFMFHQTQIALGGVANTDIRSWNLEIDNQSQPQRTLNGSADIKNILAIGKLLVKGGFEIYFENETEREKFLANTEQSMTITLTGSLIGGTVYNKMVITLPKIHYSAFPFGDLDGLVGAVVAFNAYYKIGGSPAESVVVDLYNTINAY